MRRPTSRQPPRCWRPRPGSSETSSSSSTSTGCRRPTRTEHALITLPPVISRALPIVYASDVERAARFWELLGFRRHVQLPPDGEPGYVGLRAESAGPELAVTSAEWATSRYGL